jgi:hypothetical protein
MVFCLDDNRMKDADGQEGNQANDDTGQIYRRHTSCKSKFVFKHNNLGKAVPLLRGGLAL